MAIEKGNIVLLGRLFIIVGWAWVSKYCQFYILSWHIHHVHLCSFVSRLSLSVVSPNYIKLNFITCMWLFSSQYMQLLWLMLAANFWRHLHMHTFTSRSRNKDLGYCINWEDNLSWIKIPQFVVYTRPCMYDLKFTLKSCMSWISAL